VRARRFGCALVVLGAAGTLCCSGATVLMFVEPPPRVKEPAPDATAALSVADALDTARVPVESMVFVHFQPDLRYASSFGTDEGTVLVPDRSNPRLVALCEMYDHRPFCEAGRAYLALRSPPSAAESFGRPWTLHARMCEAWGGPFHCTNMPNLALDQLSEATGVPGGERALRVLDLREGPDESLPETPAEEARHELVARIAAIGFTLGSLAMLVGGVVVLVRTRARRGVTR